MTILVIGGAGYIGSHVCQALHQQGMSPIVYDNFSTGHRWAVQWGPCIEGDVGDEQKLREVFETYRPLGVIHLASFINVLESASYPGKYYANNVVASLSLLKTLSLYPQTFLIFSSTAAVYGNSHLRPIEEIQMSNPQNVYGKTKWMVEQMISDFAQRYGIRFIIFRYFNAAGADPLGRIGEAHIPETHLIPRAIRAALKKGPKLTIFGASHPTADGTAVRDYLHVHDLASAHIKAIQWLLNNNNSLTLNLGTNQGASIEEILSMIRKKTSLEIPLTYASSNPSEPSFLIANSSKAWETLRWMPAMSDLEQIIETALHWHQKFP